MATLDLAAAITVSLTMGNRPDHIVALKKIENNIMRQMSHLMDLLKAQEDTINGGTLLDHTTIMFGCGMATGPHSTKNLPLVVAAEASIMENIKSIQIRNLPIVRPSGESVAFYSSKPWC